MTTTSQKLTPAAMAALATLNTFADHPFVYIVSAYTAANPALSRLRYSHASRIAGTFFGLGFIVYTPIGHGVSIEDHASASMSNITHQHWMQHCASILSRAAVVYVAPPHHLDDLRANDESVGVQAEIAFAVACGIPIVNGEIVSEYCDLSKARNRDAIRIKEALKPALRAWANAYD